MGPSSMRKTASGGMASKGAGTGPTSAPARRAETHSSSTNHPLHLSALAAVGAPTANAAVRRSPGGRPGSSTARTTASTAPPNARSAAGPFRLRSSPLVGSVRPSVTTSTQSQRAHSVPADSTDTSLSRFRRESPAPVEAPRCGGGCRSIGTSCNNISAVHSCRKRKSTTRTAFATTTGSRTLSYGRSRSQPDSASKTCSRGPAVSSTPTKE